MSYNKTVNDFQFRRIQGLINPWHMIFTSDASVNIMLLGLINPCIHLIESHQLYIISNLDNFPLISQSDIFSITELTLILKTIGQCDVKHIMT